MVESLQKKNKELQKRMFGISVIEGNDSDTKFFTGFAQQEHLFMFLSPFIAFYAIAFHDELFLVQGSTYTDW